MATNLPAVVAKLPLPTALDASSMPLHELTEHRTQIAIVIEVIMRSYWRDDMPDAILRDWCDELQDWPVHSVKTAMRKHRRNQPNKNPNPGHILQLLNDSYGRQILKETHKALAPPREHQRARIRDDKRRAILSKFNFRDQLETMPSDVSQESRHHSLPHANAAVRTKQGPMPKPD